MYPIWYKEETLGTQVTEETQLTTASNHMLYAKWEANIYTITLNNQSATSTGTTSVTATYGSALPAITVPTKTDYVFNGYFTSTNGGGTQYYTASGAAIKNWDLTSNTTLYAYWKSAIPEFTYSGTYATAKDGSYWYIYLKSGGTFNFTQAQSVDLFLVGGGGGGAEGGGGGGYTATHKDVALAAGTPYSITIGVGGAGVIDWRAKAGDGSATSAFGYTVNGGSGANGFIGGNGGSGGGGGGEKGGIGGSNGGNGSAVERAHSAGVGPGGVGQGTTTRAFGESTGTIYAGGGGGGSWFANPQKAGGNGGGGKGAGGTVTGSGANGAANTGGGGGGNAVTGSDYYGGTGGTGVVIIRVAL